MKLIIKDYFFKDALSAYNEISALNNDETLVLVPKEDIIVNRNNTGKIQSVNNKVLNFNVVEQRQKEAIYNISIGNVMVVSGVYDIENILKKLYKDIKKKEPNDLIIGDKKVVGSGTFNNKTIFCVNCKDFDIDKIKEIKYKITTIKDDTKTFINKLIHINDKINKKIKIFEREDIYDILEDIIENDDCFFVGTPNEDLFLDNIRLKNINLFKNINSFIEIKKNNLLIYCSGKNNLNKIKLFLDYFKQKTIYEQNNILYGIIN